MLYVNAYMVVSFFQEVNLPLTSTAMNSANGQCFWINFENPKTLRPGFEFFVDFSINVGI